MVKRGSTSLGQQPVATTRYWRRQMKSPVAVRRWLFPYHVHNSVSLFRHCQVPWQVCPPLLLPLSSKFCALMKSVTHLDGLRCFQMAFPFPASFWALSPGQDAIVSLVQHATAELHMLPRTILLQNSEFILWAMKYLWKAVQSSLTCYY